MSKENNSDDSRVGISLSSGTWLVLFEYFARSYDAWRGDDAEKSDDTFVLQKPDAGERIALWHLEGAIESTLPEMFAPDYNELIAEEKERLISGKPRRKDAKS